ncbi:MAG: DUF4190 domain-containing protein [Actinomycetota bacterium]
MAIAALIMGLLTFVLGWFLGIPAILAIAFGRSAKREIAASGGAVGGRGMATAGQVLGVIGILPYLVLLLVVIVSAIVGASHTSALASLGVPG